MTPAFEELTHRFEALRTLSGGEREAGLARIEDPGIRDLTRRLLRSGDRAAAQGFLDANLP